MLPIQLAQRQAETSQEKIDTLSTQNIQAPDLTGATDIKKASLMDELMAGGVQIAEQVRAKAVEEFPELEAVIPSAVNYANDIPGFYANLDKVVQRGRQMKEKKGNLNSLKNTAQDLGIEGADGMDSTNLQARITDAQTKRDERSDQLEVTEKISGLAKGGSDDSGAPKLSDDEYAKKIIEAYGAVESNGKDIGDHPMAANKKVATGKYGMVSSLHAWRPYGLTEAKWTAMSDAEQAPYIEKFKADPEAQKTAAISYTLENIKKFGRNPTKLRAAHYGGDGGASVVGTAAGDKPQALADGRAMPSVNKDSTSEKYIAALQEQGLDPNGEPLAPEMTQQGFLDKVAGEGIALDNPQVKAYMNAIMSDKDRKKIENDAKKVNGRFGGLSEKAKMSIKKASNDDWQKKAGSARKLASIDNIFANSVFFGKIPVIDMEDADLGRTFKSKIGKDFNTLLANVTLDKEAKGFNQKEYDEAQEILKGNEDLRKVLIDLQGYINKALEEASGKAVTENELKRFYAGIGYDGTDTDLLYGIQQAMRNMAATIQGYTWVYDNDPAFLPPEAIDFAKNSSPSFSKLFKVSLSENKAEAPKEVDLSFIKSEAGREKIKVLAKEYQKATGVSEETALKTTIEKYKASKGIKDEE